MKEHDVFISYSRKDYVDENKNTIPGNEVSKIKEALTKAGITYWFDEEGMYSGQNFVEKIVTNIENAKIFVFLSTENANKSPWTCKEIASADEFKKYIIPVRIDPTPYNKKVLFRIADLDYIDYYTNPQKGLENLIKSIKGHLDDMVAEEKRKKDEEEKRRELEREKEKELKKKKEEELRRQQKEQDLLITDINQSCAMLNNEEAKIQIDRDNLIIRAKKVIDDSQRAKLIDLISTSSPIHQKYQKKYTELTHEITELKAGTPDSMTARLREKDEKIIKSLECKCRESQAELHARELEISKLKDQLESANIDFDKEPTNDELSKWNWGAFFFNWIWGLGNGVYWPLVIIICYIVPIIGWIALLAICIVLGKKGTRWGWKAKKWDSWSSFKKMQHEWAMAIWYFLGVLIVFVMGFFIGLAS